MRTKRIGVLGAGWIATERHIPVLQSRGDVEVVGICRLGQEDLRKTQQHFSIPYGTEDYRELLSLEELDGVVVSSPHDLHHEHAMAALERGIHVLCEKPMTLRVSEAKQLTDEARRRNLHFLIPYGWNYTDYAANAKRVIEEGEIGRIEHVLCHMGSALRDLLSGTGAWFVERAFCKPELKTWSDPVLGGGFAHGQLTHAVALLLWITGLQVGEVFAFSNVGTSGADLYNAMSCRFLTGATGMVGGAGTMPPRSTYQVDIRVFGSEGMLLLDIERPRLEIVRNNGRHDSIPVDHPPGEYTCIEPLFRFVDLLQGRSVENCSPAWLGERVVAVLDAGLRSARSGRVETA